MHYRVLIIFMAVSLSASAQKERDTVLNHCPVYITDSVSLNNFFLDSQPSTINVHRLKSNLTITIEQKQQYFTLLFNEKRLEDKKYKIKAFAKSKNEVAAKYSFRSGDQVSYVNMTSGTVETKFDKQSNLWNLKVDGLLSNFVGQSVTYFKVKADFFIR